jgi:hypothetical protein
MVTTAVVAKVIIAEEKPAENHFVFELMGVSSSGIPDFIYPRKNPIEAKEVIAAQAITTSDNANELFTR